MVAICLASSGGTWAGAIPAAIARTPSHKVVCNGFTRTSRLTFDELARKTRQYLEAGTRTVWIFVAAMREIHVYTAGAHPGILSAEDSLGDPLLLPGFSAHVADLFQI